MKLYFPLVLVSLLSTSSLCVQAQTQRKQNSSWRLSKSIDKMDDGLNCALIYAKDPNIFYNTRDFLVVSYERRGGVEYFEYRVDKRLVSQMMLPSVGQRENIKIANFDGELSTGKTLLIQGKTVLGQPIDLTIDLTGFVEARYQMAKECNVPELVPRKSTGIDWPAVPASVIEQK